MVLVSDMRSVFNTGRMLGCASHVAVNDDIKRRSSRDVFLVVLSMTLYLTSLVIMHIIEKRLPVLHGLAYAIIDAAVTLQVLIFIGFSYLIEERFRQLCNMLTFSAVKGESIPDKLYGRFTLRQIWWLHCTLANATETLNSVYAIQLLLWLSSLSINAMSRIYTLNMYTLTESGKIRETMLAIICSWNLLLITTVCHITAQQANRVSEIIFAPSSSTSMKRVFLQENLEATAYFQQRRVYFFTIAGFVRVDFPLLISIISSMTTYLVILC
ncbi:uncharacterized protein LOC143345703 [Colletes latitarsis]|uniref:uncharacterized protein LOC143345703 n=1 Tax=Colletes latitarsis TaxID=2605962 RepID=UPI004035B543